MHDSDPEIAHFLAGRSFLDLEGAAMRLPADTHDDGSSGDFEERISETGSASLLVTVAEAAELLGVGRSTVYELLCARRFASVKIGNCRRIRRCDLEAFVRDLTEV